MASAMDSSPEEEGPDLLGPAWQLRWRVPEVALMLSDRSVAQARATGDRALRLRAECVAVFATNRLGRGVTATGRAIAGVREAESVGEQSVATELRVELACCARSAGSYEVALRVLQPVLEQQRIDPAVRAHALIEYAASSPVRAGDSERAAALAEADRLYVGTSVLDRDTSRLLRARVSTARAYHCRRDADYNAAVEAADAGLAFLEQLGDQGADSGELYARLVLERVHSLFELGRVRDAIATAQPVLDTPVRAASAAPAGWLRLVLATRAHLNEGDYEPAVRLLNDAAAAARRHRLDHLLAEALSTSSQAHEECAEYREALHHLRGAHAADRRWRACVYEARVQLLREFPELDAVQVPRQQSRSPESSRQAAPPGPSAPTGHSRAGDQRPVSSSKTDSVEWPSEPEQAPAHEERSAAEQEPVEDRRSRTRSDADAREIARQLMETLVNKRHAAEPADTPSTRSVSNRPTDDVPVTHWAAARDPVGDSDVGFAGAADDTGDLPDHRPDFSEVSASETSAEAYPRSGKRRARTQPADGWPDAGYTAGTADSANSAFAEPAEHERVEGRHGAVDFGVLPDDDNSDHEQRNPKPESPDRSTPLTEEPDRGDFPDVTSYVPVDPFPEEPGQPERVAEQTSPSGHHSRAERDWLADFPALASRYSDTSQREDARHSRESFDDAADLTSSPGDEPAPSAGALLGEERVPNAEPVLGSEPGSASTHGKSLAEIRESLRLFQREAFPDPVVPTASEAEVVRTREPDRPPDPLLGRQSPAYGAPDELSEPADVPVHRSAHEAPRHREEVPAPRDGAARGAHAAPDTESEREQGGRRRARHGTADEGAVRSAAEILAQYHGTATRNEPRNTHSEPESAPVTDTAGPPEREDPPEAAGLADLLAEALVAYEDGRRDAPSEEAATSGTGRRAATSGSGRTAGRAARRGTADRGEAGRETAGREATSQPQPVGSDGPAARHRKSSGDSAPGQEWPWRRTGY